MPRYSELVCARFNNSCSGSRRSVDGGFGSYEFQTYDHVPTFAFELTPLQVNRRILRFGCGLQHLMDDAKKRAFRSLSISTAPPLMSAPPQHAPSPPGDSRPASALDIRAGEKTGRDLFSPPSAASGASHVSIAASLSSIASSSTRASAPTPAPIPAPVPSLFVAVDSLSPVAAPLRAGILAPNCPEWIITYLACSAYGLVVGEFGMCGSVHDVYSAAVCAKQAVLQAVAA